MGNRSLCVCNSTFAELQFCLGLYMCKPLSRKYSATVTVHRACLGAGLGAAFKKMSDWLFMRKPCLRFSTSGRNQTSRAIAQLSGRRIGSRKSGFVCIVARADLRVDGSGLGVWAITELLLLSVHPCHHFCLFVQIDGALRIMMDENSVDFISRFSELTAKIT